MRTITACATILGIVLLAAGCNAGPKSSRGFTLPDGDAERGKVTFQQLQCHACHTVAGDQLAEWEGESELTVQLGGEVTRVKTYGELVTSIINPSHRLATGYPTQDVTVEGESKMKNYNDVMTVSQLVDLVAYLQAHYEVRPIEPTAYPHYY